VISLGFAVRADARWESQVDVFPNRGVKITIASPIDELPRAGYMPYRITIENHSGAARTWDFHFSVSGGRSTGESRVTMNQTLRVEGDSVGRVDVLVPVISSGRHSYYYRTSTVEVSGYGVDEPTVHLPSTGARGSDSVFVGMSEALAAPSLGTLKKEFERKGTQFVGSAVDLAMLGDDWRALLGFGCLWITADEYFRLTPAQRTAIKEWLVQGGRIFLCVADTASAPRSEFGFESNSADEAHPALGYVKLVPWSGGELSPFATANSIGALSGALEDHLSSGYPGGWLRLRVRCDSMCLF
jgi:hypothetical protein